MLGFVSSRVKVNQYMIIIYSVKFILIKITYTVILAIIACKIKNALNSSQNIRNQDKKNSIPALFIIVCLIPLFNNFLNWCTDIPIILYNYYNKWSREAKYTEFNFVHLPLSVSSYLLGSIIQCISYLIYFPKLRTGPCSKQTYLS